MAVHPASSLPHADPALRTDDERVRHHLPGVWRYLRMQGATAALADDLCQETFVVALQKGALRFDDAAAAVFLRRTARFLWLRARSGERLAAEQLADAVDALFVRDCADGGEALLAALRDCLQRLPEKGRTAVQRAYGLDGPAIARERLAAELGLQPNGLKTLLQRCRQQLHDCVQRRQHGT